MDLNFSYNYNKLSHSFCHALFRFRFLNFSPYLKYLQTEDEEEEEDWLNRKTMLLFFIFLGFQGEGRGGAHKVNFCKRWTPNGQKNIAQGKETRHTYVLLSAYRAREMPSNVFNRFRNPRKESFALFTLWDNPLPPHLHTHLHSTPPPWKRGWKQSNCLAVFSPLNT